METVKNVSRKKWMKRGVYVLLVMIIGIIVYTGVQYYREMSTSNSSVIVTEPATPETTPTPYTTE